jgi:type VII secretion protein EccB
MATRRDQLHSYQYLIQRVLSAFVMRETDPAQSPLRRGVGAVFGGVMVTILVAAGFGVYGIFTKLGTDEWRQDGAVVVERETGASFVYFDGRLHPTLNYTSALLASGRVPSVFRVATKALTDVPRGVPIGIAGAPDSLPGPDRIVGLPWTVCAEPRRDESGEWTSLVTLVVAAAPHDSQPLSDQGVLVTDMASGDIHLIWHGHRYQVREPHIITPALFGEMVSATPVGTAWLNALPAGMDLAPIQVANQDQPSPAVPGRRIGEVLKAETGSGPQFYLVAEDGLAPITELQKDILLAGSTTAPVTVSIAEATTAPASAPLQPAADGAEAPPAAPPLVVPDPSDLLCAVTDDPAATPEVRVGGAVPGLADALPTGAVTPDGVPLTDRVLVPSGHVAVVRVVGAPGAESGGAYSIVTDLGHRYPVPSADVLQILGYPPAQAVDVPAHLVTRIPTGPTLDPVAAIQPVDLTTQDG